MIIPENTIPTDDSQSSEAEDQQSQKDVHSNGLADTNSGPTTDEADTSMLNQAYDAAEPSFTLKLDDEE
jgi:hypothetical protein